MSYPEPDYIYKHPYLLPGKTPESFHREYEPFCPGDKYNLNPYECIYQEYSRIRLALLDSSDDISSDFFKIFHRDPEDSIGLLWQPPQKRICGIGCVKLKDIDETLYYLSDEFQEFFTSRIYFTINSYCKTQKWKYKETNLNGICRKEKYLSKLNACYVQIQIESIEEKEGLKRFSWEDVLFQVLLLEDDNIIPPVSVYAISGTAVYLFWILKDAKASLETIKTYKEINKELNRRIGHVVYCNAKAYDAARIFRVSGSPYPNFEFNKRWDRPCCEYDYTCYHVENATPYSFDDLYKYFL